MRTITKTVLTSKVDRFSPIFTLLWAAVFLFFGFVNIVLDHFWIWPEFLAVALFALTCVVGGYWLVRGSKKRAASLLLALPIVLAADVALSRAGVDRAQRSFWLAYPYYRSKVTVGKSTAFAWAESGVFFGGGWQYLLLFDPADQHWISFKTENGNRQRFLIGTQSKFESHLTNEGDCKYKELRWLGGDWYLLLAEYGIDGHCKKQD